MTSLGMVPSHFDSSSVSTGATPSAVFVNPCSLYDPTIATITSSSFCTGGASPSTTDQDATWISVTTSTPENLDLVKRKRGGRGGGKPKAPKAKIKNRETTFGNKFEQAFKNSSVVTRLVNSLRRLGGLKKRSEENSKSILHDLLDRVQSELQYKSGDQGHYQSLEDTLKRAIEAPEETEAEESAINEFLKAYDETSAWLDGEQESKGEMLRAPSSFTLAGSVGLAALLSFLQSYE